MQLDNNNDGNYEVNPVYALVEKKDLDEVKYNFMLKTILKVNIIYYLKKGKTQRYQGSGNTKPHTVLGIYF